MSNLRAEFESEIAKYCKYVGSFFFDYAVNISLKHRYMYVETPKVACSTIKTLLQRMELGSPTFYRADFEDIHNRAFSPLLKPSQVGSFDQFLKREDIVKFCFVRNPYSRLLSVYLEKIQQCKPQKRQVLMHMGKDSSRLGAPISFPDFVEVVCEQPIVNMDPHWRLQYYQTFQDGIRYDFIGRLESFGQDIARVMTNINRDFGNYLAHERRHATDAAELLGKYYTETLARKVRSKYAKDFEAFGYSDRLCEEADKESPS